MSKRKQRKERSPFDIFDEEGFLLGRQLKPSRSQGGSGYSMSVTYDDNGKPVVKVETYGDFDAAELRQDIQQRYPGAKIEGLEKQPLIRVVDEEKKKEQKSETKTEEKRRREEKRKREPLIRLVE